MTNHQEKYFQVSSTLDKYTRISKNTGNISENEIRVKSSKDTKFYVGYALHMVEKSNTDSIIIKATGNAIPKAVNVVEILKRRIEGIHQINVVQNVEVEDTYEPLEEGLDTVIVKRYLSLIEITLTRKITPGMAKEPGYQEPLPESELNIPENRKFRTQVHQTINTRQSRPRINQEGDGSRSNYRGQRQGYSESTRGYNNNYEGRQSGGDAYYPQNNRDSSYPNRGGRDQYYGASNQRDNRNQNYEYQQPTRGQRRTRGGGGAGYSNSVRGGDDVEYLPKNTGVGNATRQRIGNQ